MQPTTIVLRENESAPANTFSLEDDNGNKIGSVRVGRKYVAVNVGWNNIKVTGSYTEQQAWDIAQRFHDLLSDSIGGDL